MGGLVARTTEFLFYDHAPGITVLLNTGNYTIEQTIEELPPYGFTRQREKFKWRYQMNVQARL